MNHDLIRFLDRVRANTPGKYFVTDRCRECGACIEAAPQFFRNDNTTGHAYIHRQPTDAAGEDLCRAAMRNCPTESIFDTGLAFDWKEHPPREGDIDRAA